MERISFEFKGISLFVAMERNEVVRIGRTDEAFMDRSPLLLRAKKEIFRYLSGEKTKIDLPFRLSGTPFQRKVYEAILSIPYGERRSYSDVSAMLCGNGKASRAIGTALKANPLLFLVPCHRIVCADGNEGGYVLGKSFKRYLLEMESVRRLSLPSPGKA